MRKPVFDDSNEVRHIPPCVVTINCPLIIDSQKVCEILKVIIVYANLKKKLRPLLNCINMSRVMRKPTFLFSTRSDTNPAEQLENMARGLNFGFRK